MTQGMRRRLLVVNYAAAISFASGFAYVQTLGPLHTSMHVTELDRAGVINHEALQKSHPTLARNPRHDLGQWIARDEHSVAVIATLAGLAVAVLNTVELHLAGRSANRHKGTAPASGWDSEREQ